MHITGIIAEYNPFHNGHAYQLRAARALGATHIVAVMGGSFTQRGECAVMDKLTRAHAALLCGADLVIELPLPYAVSSAERFAFGGVSLLDALGCVDTLVFGSECGDVPQLTQTAVAVDDPALKASLRQHLSDGLVFPKARQLALLQVFGDDCALVLNEPNNILGVEYIKWLLRLNSPIAPVTITRTGATHESDESCAGIASASLIRKRMLAGGSWQSLVPSQAAGLYENELSQGYAPRSLAPLERAILARLRTISQAELLTLPDVTEGLEGRIYKAARTASSLDELYQLIKSKRYTLSRIRRIILCAYLGIPSDLQTRTPPYIRVLGLNERGRQILSRAKETAALTFSTSLAKLEGLCADASRFAGIEAAATDVFSLCAPKIMPCGLDFTAEAVIIK